ncbi:MAG: multiprotein bridging factor aMBF1 [Candidatus Woesearchaeota archaeon]
MQCEMCGKEEPLKKAIIEGVDMRVCSSCAKYGKIIESKPKPIIREKPKYKSFEPEYVEEIIPQYNDIIRKAVMKTGIQEDAIAKRVGMKESVLKAYMRGSMKPSVDDAKKLEKYFTIRLIEKIKETGQTTVNTESRANDLTIGDMIRIRKR